MPVELYLIRHTTPAVARGICYGQTDLDVTDSLYEEAATIRQHLPDHILSVHSSPLRRCARLAAHLFPSHTVQFQQELMEIDCGRWEMRSWDELPPEELDPWMNDFVQVPIPGGESYLGLHERVSRCFNRIRAGMAAPPAAGAPAAEPAPESAESARAATEGSATSAATHPVVPAVVLISHGGPIRSILASITGTALADSFKAFALHYGCVVRITENDGVLSYTLLSNPVQQEKEQHKPSRFYKK